MRIADSSDHRIELIAEVLRAIKVIKLYAWENSFVKWVLACSSIQEMENGYDKEEEDEQYHGGLAMAFFYTYNRCSTSARMSRLSIDKPSFR